MVNIRLSNPKVLASAHYKSFNLDKVNKGMTRRDFIKTVGAGALILSVLGIPTGCATSGETKKSIIFADASW